MLLLIAAVATIQLPPTATRLDVLLKQASTLSHETMRAGGEMGSHIVLIDSKPRPPAELRDALAKANFGRWHQVGKEWVIDEDAAALQAWNRATRDTAIKRIRVAQANLLAASGDPLPPAELVKRLEAVEQGYKGGGGLSYSQAVRPLLQRAPIQVAIDRIIGRLDPEVLFDDSDAVFTSRPNRLQHPLPENAAAEVAAFAKAQAAWSAAAGTPERVTGEMRRAMTDPRVMTAAPPADGLRLFIRTNSTPTSALFTVMLADSSGKARFTVTQQLFFRATAADEQGLQLDDETKIPVPKEVQESLKAFRAITLRDGPVPATPEPLRSQLLAPDRFEPLEAIGGPIARLFARSQASDLVAWLPDSAFRALAIPPSETVTAERLRRALNLMGVEQEKRDGWTVLRPREPRPNLDRRAFATLLKAADRSGYVSFDSLIDFAGTGGFRKRAEIVLPVLEAVLPRSTDLFDRVDPNAVELYASLSQSQRAALTAGGSLDWAKLAPQSRRLIEAAALSSRSLALDSGAGGYGIGLQAEPTELLGGADASKVRLTAQSQDDIALLAMGPWDDRLRKDSELTRLYNLATALVSRQRSSAQRFDAFPQSIDRYLSGRIRDQRMMVELAPGVSLNLMIIVGEIDLRQPASSLEGLPASTRKKLDDYMIQAAGRIRQ